jgi:hypothetical protein
LLDDLGRRFAAPTYGARTKLHHPKRLRGATDSPAGCGIHWFAGIFSVDIYTLKRRISSRWVCDASHSPCKIR